MNLNFFLGMDRKTFEKGLRPVKKGYIPQGDDIIFHSYRYFNGINSRFHIFTNFEDGTTDEGWGIFYDIYDVIFYKRSGEDILSGFPLNKFSSGAYDKNITVRKKSHDYQYPNRYENWLWKGGVNKQDAIPYIWKGLPKIYLNWNENPFEVK
jgi:hypothetical protein